MVEIRIATSDDVEYVARYLRSSDYKELSLSHGDPAEAIRNSVNGSLWTKSALLDGVPVLVYGLHPSVMDSAGVPWMVATDQIAEIGSRFVLGSLSEIEIMQHIYPFLYNQVHCENHLSIRWLRWLGFTVDETPCGPQNAFFYFWRRSCVKQ